MGRGLDWPGSEQGQVAGSCIPGKMRGISRLAEEMLASEGGLHGEFSAVLIYFAAEALSQLYGVSQSVR